MIQQGKRASSHLRVSVRSKVQIILKMCSPRASVSALTLALKLENGPATYFQVSWQASLCLNIVSTFSPRQRYFAEIQIRTPKIILEKFHFGKIYVSVGFVDLFPMLVGSFHPAHDGSQTEPLTFVAYDKSDVVIARAIVIYEMLLRFCTHAIYLSQVSVSQSERNNSISIWCPYLNLSEITLSRSEALRIHLNITIVNSRYPF